MGCVDCTEMQLAEGKEPPCGGCYVELLPENAKSWELFMVCQDQVRRAGTDGVVVGLDCKSVIAVLELYGEGQNKQMFEDIRICSGIKQELVK